MDISGSRVLVVDDNSVNRAILSEQMAAWSFDAAAAASGEEAIAVIKAAHERGLRIDCMVLDYHMPQMNGADVVSAMRQMPEADGIQVVMLTSVDHTMSVMIEESFHHRLPSPRSVFRIVSSVTWQLPPASNRGIQAIHPKVLRTIH